MATKGWIAAGALLLAATILILALRTDPPPPPLAALPQAPPPAAPAAPPPPVPAPDMSGLSLHGLLASGAILGYPGGAQRLIPIGREALPGLTLLRIEQHHAVLASAVGEVRLGFDGPEQPAAPTSAPSAPSDDSLPYRLGLARRPAGGFTVRPGADLPALARAGIRPGDTILRVGGVPLDEERMLELPWQIANSNGLEFEVERGGRRVRLPPPPH